MIFLRLYDDALAQASYLIGCSVTREALVVDPNRDVEAYLAAAEDERVRITHVAETHIHADFVSGARELAARAGARLHLSDEGGDAWRYRYAHGSDALLLRHGDSFGVGTLRIDVMHTPGHTPEHLCFVVTDTAAADRPMGALTGDFLFVSDVGRPDLLERAAKHEGTMEQSARALFRSLQHFGDALPDFVQIWPGHGAGSACGKSLGAVPQTTLGYEKLFNWAFQRDEESFVREVLVGQPEPPMYFAEMKRINREGPPLLRGFPQPACRDVEEMARVLAGGGLIVDTRPTAAFKLGHVPGSLHVPAGSRSFSTWAGSVLPYDRDLYLVADERALPGLVRDLVLIGLERVAGYFEPTAVEAWLRSRGEPGMVDEVAPTQLEQWLSDGGAEVIDVRNGDEWATGHIPGSRNLPLGRLADQLDQVPRDRPLVVHCQSGARAWVAIGLLRAHGLHPVLHLAGDLNGWSAAGRPLHRPVTP